MITKINKIKNFGIFRDFSWNSDLGEFKRLNLLYGWNGSGKTTLSKLYTLLEQKNDAGLLEGLNNYDFNFTLDDSSIIDKNNYLTNSLNLFVYNENFKEKNIDWNNVIKSILLISDEVITEKTELDEKKIELGNKDEKTGILGDIKKKTDEKIELEESIDKFYSASAKKIKDEFKVIDTSDTYYFNYEKRKFKTFINSRIIDVQNIDNKLEASEVNKLKISIKPNILSKIELDFKNIELTRLKEIQGKLLGVLTTSLIVNEVSRLKEQPRIGKWVEDGIEIHKFYNSTKCEFCNQDLPQSRLQELERHFSDEFKKLKEKIKSAIDWLPQQKISYDVFNDDIDFYVEYQDEFRDVKKDIKISIEIINQLFDTWLKSLKEKQENPFEIIQDIRNIDSTILDTYNSLINKLMVLINNHNNKTENFEKESKLLKKNLELHYATTYYHEFELKKKTKSIVSINADLEINIPKKDELISKIKILEAKLSNEAFGATEFNKKLHKFLGRKNISLEFDNISKGYKIIRDDKQATNLSEGEKTAISFVYFITKIKENENKIEDSIIVVDDPISSFDSNNLFSAYAFLKIECEKAKQLFVITHNFAYFKLIRDWFLGSNLNKFGRANVLLIESYDDNSNRASRIKKAKDSLIKYNSEYHFIFSALYNYKDLEVDETNAYLIGNLSRKLLEAFLSFKYPYKRNNFKQLCDVAIVDEQLREKIYRFINKYSHNQTIEFFEAGDDTILSEGTTIVKDILENIIKVIDEKHFNEMEKMVQDG